MAHDIEITSDVIGIILAVQIKDAHRRLMRILHPDNNGRFVNSEFDPHT